MIGAGETSTSGGGDLAQTQKRTSTVQSRTMQRRLQVLPHSCRGQRLQSRLLQALMVQALLLPGLLLSAGAQPANPTGNSNPTATPQATPRSGAEAESPAAEGKSPAAEGTGENGLSAKEKALLQQIRSLKAPRWRRFGACRYDWSGWRLAPEGVRTTSAQCGEPPAADTVAVHCATLKVSRRVGQEAWSKWRLPMAAAESSSVGGEDLMVAALCANAQPIPETKPEKKPEAKPEAASGSKSQPASQPASKPPANAQPTTKAKPQPTDKPKP